MKPSTPKADRRGSLKLGAIAEERNIVTTSKETGKNVAVILYLAKKSGCKRKKSGFPGRILKDPLTSTCLCQVFIKGVDISGNPNNLEMEVVISTGGSLPPENVSNGPRKAGLRVAMDRVRGRLQSLCRHHFQRKPTGYARKVRCARAFSAKRARKPPGDSLQGRYLAGGGFVKIVLLLPQSSPCCCFISHQLLVAVAYVSNFFLPW